MRKKIGLTIIAAVAFFGIVCVPSGRADEKLTPLQTAISSTTVSGGDITILTGSSVGNIGVDPSGFSVSPVPEPSVAAFFAPGILLLIILAKFKSHFSRAIRPTGYFVQDLRSPATDR
jgi:hypothetical protein